MVVSLLVIWLGTPFVLRGKGIVLDGPLEHGKKKGTRLVLRIVWLKEFSQGHPRVEPPGRE